MAVVCYRYKLSPAEFWALDREETTALMALLEDLAADG